MICVNDKYPGINVQGPGGQKYDLYVRLIDYVVRITRLMDKGKTMKAKIIFPNNTYHTNQDG